MISEPHQNPLEKSDVPGDAVPGDAVPGDAVPGDAVPGDERTNFVLIAVYQIVVRIGWIFKTESIIIPAALDSLGGAGWARGCLPMLNRFGQSIPPLLSWPFIKSSAYKKHWLAGCTLTMGIVFWLVALIWLYRRDPAASGPSTGTTEPSVWLPLVFLFLYGVFFISTGINQLVFSTLIGKLVQTRRRGRLMLSSNVVGAMCAVTGAWFVLRHWLEKDQADFFLIFGFAGTCFLVAAGLTRFWKEPPDRFAVQPFELGRLLRGVAAALIGDRRFRLLALMAGLFGMSMTLFPHYQALARTRLGIGFSDLLPWVIAQNVGMAFFSIPAGTIADRLGNRLVLRAVLLALCMPPILALYFSNHPQIGKTGFTLVYFFLGLTPVTMRIMSNYALEFATPQRHTRYLATLSIAMAFPAILTSTFLGWLLDQTSFELVFGFVIGCLFLGWLLTLVVYEPRNHLAE